MKIRNNLLLVATLLLFSIVSVAQKRQERQAVGQVTFKINNAGIEVMGTMDILAADIVINEKSLEQSRVIATADPASVNTGVKIRDHHLRRPDYFDVMLYPIIKLRSKSFKRSGKQFDGYFDLTIKDITRPVTISFRKKISDTKIVYEGSFTVNRIDFNLGDRNLILDENVTVLFSLAQ